MTAEVLTAVPSGNTTPEVTANVQDVINDTEPIADDEIEIKKDEKNDPVYRARAFQFTMFDMENWVNLCEKFRDLKSCDYIVAGKEICPTTKKEHVHIYVHLTSTYRLSKKILAFGAHIEICRGSPKQNIAYVKKDGNIVYEYGKEPHQGMITIGELKKMSEDEVPANLQKIKEHVDRKAKKLNDFFQMLDEIEKDDLKAPEIIYITGESGSGKTYGAYKDAIKSFPKEKIGKLTIENGFVDPINEEAECFVIEEFRPSQMKASSFLQLTDKYGYSCNVKGSHVHLRPKRIYICSIIPPEEIYRDEEINAQFLRRITKRIEVKRGDWMMN